jgi:carbamoyltransferase
MVGAQFAGESLHRMNILGLQFGHDAGAVVLRDGEVASFVLRERYNRVKHAMSLDVETIERALTDAGLSESDIDYCAVTSTQKTELVARDPARLSLSLERHPGHKAPATFVEVIERAKVDPSSLLFSFAMELLYHNSKREDLSKHSVSYYFPEYKTVPESEFFRMGWLDTYISAGPWAKEARLADLAERDCTPLLKTDALRHGFHFPATLMLNGRRIPAYFIQHHMAHAASIYYLSGYERAAILTHDGFESGKSYHSGMFYYGDGHRIFPLAPHHLVVGGIYEATGIRLNLGLVGPSGKLMGLAPYGEPKFFDAAFVGNLYDLKANGKLQPLHDWVTHCLSRAELQGYNLAQFRDRKQTTAPVNADIAASTQKLFEETLLATVRTFRRMLDRTGLGPLPLCYAGGTALNCPANSLIAADGSFASVDIPPWCDDSGLSIGAALALYHNVLDHPLPAGERQRPAGTPVDAYLGPRLGDGETEAALARHQNEIRWQPLPDWDARAAQDIADDKVIGWFEGRSEIGPRALGHRSILADARQAENWGRVNRIKGREPWRPFAPAVLADQAAEWFSGGPLPSPHMLFTAEVTSDQLPAITHIDGSARIQTVDEDCGAFHGLLRHFQAITGVPVVLNTSFNGPSEPIVETPEDALRFFLQSELDALYIEGRQVLKR